VFGSRFKRLALIGELPLLTSRDGRIPAASADLRLLNSAKRRLHADQLTIQKILLTFTAQIRLVNI
jgi:hypothetical protein